MEPLEMLRQNLQGAGIDASSLTLINKGEPESGFALTVPGLEAFVLWARLRPLVSRTRHWPVLIGGLEEWEYLHERLEEFGPPSQELLNEAEALDLEEWFQAVRAERLEMLEAYRGLNDDETNPDELDDESEPDADKSFPDVTYIDGEPRGDWPEEDLAVNEYTIGSDILSGAPLPKVWLVLVPVEAPWQVPLFFRFGGWNECPDPEVHANLFKHWHERYGVEVVGMSHDTIELRVEHPVSDRDEALELARRQYDYCPDLVDQGTHTLERLAASLLGSTVWYFWWD